MSRNIESHWCMTVKVKVQLSAGCFVSNHCPVLKKITHLFPLAAFLLLYSSTAGPAAPWSCPRCSLTPVLSLRGQRLHHAQPPLFPASVSVWLFSIPSHFAEPSQTHHHLSFISPASPPNSTRPLFAPFPFFAPSLSLRTPHYPLSSFLILPPISHCLPPPNLLLFTTSLHLLPFSNLHVFFF